MLFSISCGICLSFRLNNHLTLMDLETFLVYNRYLSQAVENVLEAEKLL